MLQPQYATVKGRKVRALTLPLPGSEKNVKQKKEIYIYKHIYVCVHVDEKV